MEQQLEKISGLSACGSIPLTITETTYADGNEAPRLYILVPEAKPWGLTNQPGFLVSSISMELAVT